MSSRLESLLQALAEGKSSDIVPGSRIETYLKAIINGDTDVPNPQSRMGAYLHHIAKNGLSGGGSGGSSGGSGGSSGGGSGGETEDTTLKDIIERTAVNLTLTTDVNKIGDYVFNNCSNLMIVDLQNATSIGVYAFRNCTSFRILVLRSKRLVKLLSANAFIGTSISAIYVPAAFIDAYKTDNNWSAFANKFRVLEDYTVDGTITGELDLGRFRVRFFSGDTLLQESYMSYGEIPFYTGAEPTPEEDYTFVGWSPEISIVTNDVDYVAQFKYAKSVTRLYLNQAIETYSSDTCTSVGPYAFYGYNELTSVDMSNATSVGNSAFSGCTKLTSVDLPNVVSISGNNVFSSCYELTSVDMPNVKTIKGSHTFLSCRKLTSINMPNLESTDSSTFTWCYALASVNIPNLISLGSSTFQQCTALTSIDLPNVASIGGGAFGGCSELASVRLPATPPTLSNTSAFSGINSDCVFYIPTGSLSAYQSATNWSSLTSTYSFIEEDR